MQILPHSTKNIIAKTQSSFQHDIGPKLPLSTVTDLSLRHRPYCWNVCRPIFHSNLRFMCDKAFMNEWINTFEWIPLFATTSAERKKKIYKNYTREDTNTAKKGTNRTTVDNIFSKCNQTASFIIQNPVASWTEFVRHVILKSRPIVKREQTVQVGLLIFSGMAFKKTIS